MTGLGNGRRASHERGVILPLAAAGIVLAVIAAALSIDLGSMAWKRRDLQKVADLASLDASRVIEEFAHLLPLDTLNESDPDAPLPTVTNRARASAKRNGLDWNKVPLFQVELGEYERASRTFTPCLLLINDGLVCDADAVRVTIEDTVPRFFAFWTEDTSTTRVDAIAQIGVSEEGGDPTQSTDNHTTFSIGSFLARAEVDPADDPLPLVLERLVRAAPGSLSADAVSYRGIADANLTLRQLAAETTVGEPEGFLDSTVAFGELLEAAASALQSDPDSPAFAAGAELRKIQLASAEVGGVGVGIGKIFKAGTSEGAALDSDFNVLDMVMSAAMVANGDHFLTFDLGSDITTAQLPEPLRSQVVDHVGSLTMRMTVIEAPQICVACVVDESASTAQVKVDLVTSLADDFVVKQSDVDETFGTLTGAIEGTVTDEVSGVPLPDARVTVEGSGLCTRTDENGRYVINPVLAVDVLVTAATPEHLPVTREVTVQRGTTVSRNFTLPRSQVVGEVLPSLCSDDTGTIVGEVVDQDTGAPLADATVSVDGTGMCTSTDENGNFLISPVVAGEASVSASADFHDLGTISASVPVGGTAGPYTITLPTSTLPDGVLLPGPGCPVGDEIIGTSQIEYPLSFEGIRGEATVAGISCSTVDPRFVNLDVDTATHSLTIADTGSGPVDVLVSDTMAALASAIADLDLDSGELGEFFGFPDEEDDPADSWGNPFDPRDETQTFGVTDPQALFEQASGAINGALTIEEIDLGPLEIRPLVQNQIDRLEARLNDQISDGTGAVTGLVDWMMGSFGVRVLGADVTVSDLTCITESEAAPPARTITIPILVQ